MFFYQGSSTDPGKTSIRFRLIESAYVILGWLGRIHHRSRKVRTSKGGVQEPRRDARASRRDGNRSSSTFSLPPPPAHYGTSNLQNLVQIPRKASTHSKQRENGPASQAEFKTSTRSQSIEIRPWQKQKGTNQKGKSNGENLEEMRVSRQTRSTKNKMGLCPTEFEKKENIERNLEHLDGAKATPNPVDAFPKIQGVKDKPWYASCPFHHPPPHLIAH